MSYLIVLFYVIAASTIALNMIVNKLDEVEFKRYQLKKSTINQKEE